MLDSMSGSGTEQDPYQITNVKKLQAINQDLTAHYELVCDVNVQDTRERVNRRVFNPIGCRGDPFTGTFDGNNYEIINFYINQSDRDYVGLFNYNIGRIRNLGLRNATVIGDSSVGGLVGVNKGYIASSYVEGDISGTEFVGGLVAYNSGDIESSHFRGETSGESRVGGLVGFNFRYIESSYSLGYVSGDYIVGALAGENRGEIVSSYSLNRRDSNRLIGWQSDNGLDSSFLFSILDGNSTTEYFDLVIYVDDCEISYTIDRNILYLRVDTEVYYCSDVSTAEVHRLEQSLERDIVEISERFKASKVAATEEF